jgi:hypothetical protein
MDIEAFSRAVLRFRRISPNTLRQLYRIVRLASMPRQGSISIPQELLANCKVCASRRFLVSQLPHRGCIAEVGTARGKFAEFILIANDPAELHLIDLDLSQLPASLLSDERVRTHEGFSHKVLETFPGSYFDWIYIDGDHSYDGVRRDIEAAAAKVKPSGFLVFDDFFHIGLDLGSYGVQRAVVEFAVEQLWEFAWFAIQPLGNHNVALRRP